MENKLCTNKDCGFNAEVVSGNCKVILWNALHMCKHYTDKEQLKMPKMLSLWKYKDDKNSACFVQKINGDSRTVRPIHIDDGWCNVEDFYAKFEPYTEDE